MKQIQKKKAIFKSFNPLKIISKIKLCPDQAKVDLKRTVKFPNRESTRDILTGEVRVNTFKIITKKGERQGTKRRKRERQGTKAKVRGLKFEIREELETETKKGIERERRGCINGRWAVRLHCKLPFDVFSTSLSPEIVSRSLISGVHLTSPPLPPLEKPTAISTWFDYRSRTLSCPTHSYCNMISQL